MAKPSTVLADSEGSQPGQGWEGHQCKKLLLKGASRRKQPLPASCLTTLWWGSRYSHNQDKQTTFMELQW